MEHPPSILAGVDREDLLSVLHSSGFQEKVEYLNRTSTRFRDLPEDKKLFALAIHFLGKQGGMETELNRFLFTRPIPTVEEFLTDTYIGPMAHYYRTDTPWKQELREVFSPDSVVLEWVITGAIGTAKSSVSCLAHFYNLFRVTSLRNPQLTMGSDATKSMTLQLMTVSKAKAAETLLNRFIELLASCSFFQEVPYEKDFGDFVGDYSHITPYKIRRSDGEILFKNSIRIASGSREIHAIGSDLFGATLDEAEFRGGSSLKVIEGVFELYSQLLERIRSRFRSSRYILITLVSSITNERGVIASYIKDSEKVKDQRKRISQYSIWDIKTPNYDRKNMFCVFRGNRRHPSRVMSDEEKDKWKSGDFVVPSNCEVLEVPGTYKSEFIINVERSLRNLAGKYTITDEIPFDHLDGCVDSSLCSQLDLVCPLGPSPSLLEQLPMESMRMTPIGKRLARFPNAYRYAHGDLADTGTAGITVLHKEVGDDGRVMYVVDLCLRIQSPDRISFEKVTQFAIDLREKMGVRFYSFTADSYQSTSFLQKLATSNVAEVVKVVSVDRNIIPYNNLATVIAEGSLKMGEMRVLRKELESIYYHRGKPVVQGDGRKDVADSIAGAVFGASLNQNDLPVNPYSTGPLIPAVDAVAAPPPGFVSF